MKSTFTLSTRVSFNFKKSQYNRPNIGLVYSISTGTFRISSLRNFAIVITVPLVP